VHDKSRETTGPISINMKDLRCPQCPASQATGSYGGFIVNRRKHSGLDPFYCTACQKSFATAILSNQLNLKYDQPPINGQQLAERIADQFKDELEEVAMHESL